MEQDQEFVETAVRHMVRNPESVRTERVEDTRGVLITLFVHDSDLPFVIGRRGQAVDALRTLLHVVAGKRNLRVNLRIHEPNGGARVTP